jgi:hypothetical protein
MYRFVIHCGLNETVMGKPHPIALRSRVVAFVDEGMGIAHAARISAFRRALSDQAEG